MKKHAEKSDTKRESYPGRNIVGAIFGITELFLALRLIFKLLGVNRDNGFVRIVYNTTQLIVGIIEGVFSGHTANRTETAAVIEPATILAMPMVAAVGRIVLKMMKR